MYLKKWKRTKKVISLIAAVSMLSTSMETAVAATSINTDIPPVTEEAGLNVPDSQPVVVSSETVSQSAIVAGSPDLQPSAGEMNPADESSGQTAGVPEPQEVYDRMIKLKETYPEGMTWTNNEPYGTSGSMGTAYRWKGGPVMGNVSSGVGCAAFAFILSDEGFGDLRAREIYDVSFENVNVGDILRVGHNSHSVIVLQKSTAGVIIAEGNYNKTVHWGRVLSKEEVLEADFIITRYPENYNPSGTPEDDTIVQSGNEGSLKWTLTGGGTLTISGSGDMGDFATDNPPSWNTYNSGIHTIVIENGITSIGDYAFYQSPALSVYMPSSVTGIGQSAFRESGILSVTVPGSVGTIENDAFNKCEKLVSATVSEGVKSIGERAFKGCTALKYMDFPSGITELGAAAFTDCKEMTRVRFKPGSETVTIGDNLFTHCWNLTDVTLPEKADCISAGMFMGCNQLPKLYIPAGVTKIKGLDEMSGGPFAQCPALTEINFAGSEATWNSIGGPSAMNYSGSKAKVNFDVPFPDPFIEDAEGHNHNWSSADWGYDENYHWRECTAEGCPVTNNNEKGSYAQHSYGSWIVDVSATSYQSGSKHRDCSVCSYRQTSSIPASGSSSSGSPGSYGGSWGWGSSGSISQPVTSGNTDTSGNTNKDSDNKDENPANTDQSTGSTDSNKTDGSSSDLNDSGNSDQDSDADDTDDSSSSVSNQKQLKTKFKKQLKADLKQQIRKQVKTKLKKQLKAESKLKSKAKLKKQLKAEIKPQVKKILKKQLKKQYGEELGADFTDLFNLQFNAQFNKLYNEQFQVQYKKLLSKR